MVWLVRVLASFFCLSLIKRLGIKRHYDNNKEQVDKINSNTQAEGVLWP